MTKLTMRERLFINAYNNMRRIRFGLHDVRDKAKQAIRDNYRHDFKNERSEAGDPANRYKIYCQKVDEFNLLRKEENSIIDTFSHGYQKHKILPKHSEKHFHKYLDVFTSLDRYIRYMLHDTKIFINFREDFTDQPNDEEKEERIYADTLLYHFGNLTPKEQYDRIRIWLTIGAPGKKRDNRRKAMKAVEVLLKETIGNEDLLEALYIRQGVPASNSHALKTTRIAKLILGEKIRYPTSNKGERSKLYTDSRMVNKLAMTLENLNILK